MSLAAGLLLLLCSRHSDMRSYRESGQLGGLDVQTQIHHESVMQTPYSLEIFAKPRIFADESRWLNWQKFSLGKNFMYMVLDIPCVVQYSILSSIDNIVHGSVSQRCLPIAHYLPEENSI